MSEHYSLLRRVAVVLDREGPAGVYRRLHRRVQSRVQECRREVAWRWSKVLGQEIVDVNGYRMAIDFSDPGISRELALFGVHEPFATREIIEFARGAEAILDLGANMGYYSLLFLTKLSPRPRLFAVEPASVNIGRLRRNLAINGLEDACSVIAAAVSDRDGYGTLNLAAESNWHTLLPADERHRASEEVRVISLDSLVSELGLEKLDLLRMDIEGYETVVFRGMQRVLRTLRPKLAVEVHPQLVGTGPIVKLLRSLLDEHGYRAVRVIDREQDFPWSPQEHEQLDLEKLLECDLSHRCFTVFLEPSASANRAL